MKRHRLAHWLHTAPFRAFLALAAILVIPAPGGRAGHLLGPVPRDVTRTGVGAIAADVEYVDCLDCHAAHGSIGRVLLNPECTTSQGCAACHIGVSPERGPRTHPVDQHVTDPTVLTALREAEVVLGPGDTVVCLSCHSAHADEQLTSHSRVAQDRCITCHPDQLGLRGGGHDLRPGAESHVVGACLSCHTIHGASGPALGLAGGDLLDPTGCLSCHADDGDAETVIDPQANHPLYEPNPAPRRLPAVGRDGSRPLGEPGDMGCLTCHDTHAPATAENPLMLRIPGGDAGTCTACHEQQASLVGTDHDLRRVADRLDPALGAQLDEGGTCLACHGMHQPRERSGWDGPLDGPDASPAVWACLGCHQQGNAYGATEVLNWDHPTDLLLTTYKLPWVNFGELPLYDPGGRPTDSNELGEIACLTCHEPHRWSAKQPHRATGADVEGDILNSFLRDDWEPFCSGCHGEDAIQAYRYFHDESFRQKMQERLKRRDWPIYE